MIQEEKDASFQIRHNHDLLNRESPYLSYGDDVTLIKANVNTGRYAFVYCASIIFGPLSKPSRIFSAAGTICPFWISRDEIVM